MPVALLAEGVDRNKTVVPVWFISNAIALLMEDAGRNYSTAKRVSFQDLPYAVVRSVEPFHLSDHQLRATRWHFWSHTGYFIPMRAKKGKKEHHAFAQCSKWTTKPSCRMPRGSVQVDSILAVVADEAITLGNVNRRLFPTGNINAGFAIQTMNHFAFQQADNHLSFITRNHSDLLHGYSRTYRISLYSPSSSLPCGVTFCWSGVSPLVTISSFKIV